MAGRTSRARTGTAVVALALAMALPTYSEELSGLASLMQGPAADQAPTAPVPSLLPPIKAPPLPPATSRSLRNDLRRLQADLQRAVDQGAVAMRASSPGAASEALVLGHWCEQRASQILLQLKALGGKPRPGATAGPYENELRDARVIVATARELIQRIRGQPAHFSEEGPLDPSSDNVLTRYEND